MAMNKTDKMPCLQGAYSLSPGGQTINQWGNGQYVGWWSLLRRSDICVAEVREFWLSLGDAKEPATWISGRSVPSEGNSIPGGGNECKRLWGRRMPGKEASVIGWDHVGHCTDFGFYSERNSEGLENFKQKTTQPTKRRHRQNHPVKGWWWSGQGEGGTGGENHGYILKVELTGFVVSPSVGNEKQKGQG